MIIYYGKELKALNKSRIRYLIVGGMAVNLYGVHRLTRDLDLMIDLSRDHFEKFVQMMAGLGYRTNVPKDKWDQVVAIAFKDTKDEDKRIDVFLRNPIDFDLAYKRRKVFKADGLSISCVALDDLLEMKNKADRLRDWIDIGSLQRMRELKKNEDH